MGSAERWTQNWGPLIWIFVWFAATSGGLLTLVAVHLSPGDRGENPLHWPTAAPWTRQPQRMSLLMFAHPRCPCTRAAIRELAVVRARLNSECNIRVVFVKPLQATGDWEQTDIVRQARALSDIEVVWDENGTAAELFGVKTSGHTLLYDAQGLLRFSGGITAARGHDGDNAGRGALIALGLEGRTAIGRTPVFGCSLTQPELAPTRIVNDSTP